EVVVVELAYAQALGGRRRRVAVPLDRRPVRAGLLQRQHRPLALLGVPFAQGRVVGLGGLQQGWTLLVVEERSSDRHRAGRILDPDDRTATTRRHLHGRVGARGGRATDQKRDLTT